MFSTYMIPDNTDIESLLDPMVDVVIIAKDFLGNAYLPEWGFNGIGDLHIGQGYQIKLSAINSLEVCGEYAFPEQNPIDMPSGWNMVGYLRLEGANAESVLADIYAADNLVIAKDFLGNAYLPDWNFNAIGDMVPGQAYQLKINNADTLQYLSNDASYRFSSLTVTENKLSHFISSTVSDNNMTVIIKDAAWDILPEAGAEIAAYDKSGNFVGSAIYSSPVTVISVWGDDATTPYKDGLVVSEAVSFKLWTSGEVRDFNVADWFEGSSSYIVDAINVASAIETNNVITDVDATDRVLLKVINVLGQEVSKDDEVFKGTVLFNIYDDGSVEKRIE